MKECQHCHFKNIDASTYCERCGTYLEGGRTSLPTVMPAQIMTATGNPQPQSPYSQSAMMEQTPSPVQTPFTPPPPPSYIPSMASPASPQQSRQRSLARRITSATTRSIVYLFGSAWVAIGVAGALFGVYPHDNNPGTAGFLIASAILLILLVILLLFHRKPLIPWWGRLVLLVVATLGGIIALVVDYMVEGQNFNNNVTLGAILLGYGLAIDIAAML